MKPVVGIPDLLLHDSPEDAVSDVARVHLWLADLDAGDSGSSAWSLLSVEERDRAARLKTPLLQRRFIASRFVLRHTLGNLLKVAPDKLRFDTTANGKPHLTNHVPVASGSASGVEIRFNLSHSENVMLLGVSFGCDIGVDVELVKPDLDVISLAETQFNQDDCVRLRKLIGAERVREFYRLWTRYEAIGKATGEGIASSRPASEGFEIHQFDFQSGPHTVMCAVARVR